MTLPSGPRAGSRLGPYELLALVGAGGMGEVYRARDPRLSRDVAVKVLPAAFSSDPDRLRRFEQEARAAGSLNHPHVLTVHDVGVEAGVPYVVSELLEGETLGSRLTLGALPVRKTLELAREICEGLAAAHDKGIVHRDLKPANIFVTSQGHAKILDFGLAKLRTPSTGDENTGAMSAASTANQTRAGVVLGTVGYMSPEQIRGEVLDGRSDIFSLGSVLYEMLSGRRPFRGPTSAETMHAILNEDPPALEERVGPGIERVVRRCLEKRPEERFHSARDVAFALEAVSGSSGPTLAPERRTQRRGPQVVGLGAAVVAIGLAAYLAGRQVATTSPPVFQRLTFRPGAVTSAAFAPDGQTIVYSAAWEGRPPELFLTRPETPESRPLGLPNAEVPSVSSTGEMLLLLGPSLTRYLATGTLARMPMTGGAPRELLQGVAWADWAPDGARVAVLREVDGKRRIEFPIGKVLCEAHASSEFLAVSPGMDRIAFNDGTTIATVDLEGTKRALSSGWAATGGVEWSLRGEEIWFVGSRNMAEDAIYGVTPSGDERLIAQLPGRASLLDLSRDGRVLAAIGGSRKGMIGLVSGEPVEKEVSWLDWGHVADLSSDGRLLLFSEVGSGGGEGGSVYLRKTDGSPAVRLGRGDALALSPDGNWALAVEDQQLTLLPAGAGEPKALTERGFECISANWFPDGERITIVGREQGRELRSYVQELETGTRRPLTPEGSRGSRVSPDGRWIVALGRDAKLFLYPVDQGEPREVQGIEAGEVPIQWSADGRFIYLRRPPESGRVRVSRLDLTSGQRSLFKEYLHDPTGAFAFPFFVVTRDGRYYAYTYSRHSDDLYLLTGLH